MVRRAGGEVGGVGVRWAGMRWCELVCGGVRSVEMGCGETVVGNCYYGVVWNGMVWDR